MLNRVSVYACESQPVVIEGLRSVFNGCEDLELVGHAPDLPNSLHHLILKPADLLLIGQPPTTRSALPLLAQAREMHLPARLVLWVGEISEMDAFRALQMGARGIATRTQSTDLFMDCLRTVARGSVWIDGSSRLVNTPTNRRGDGLRLTRREREIVEFICRGLKNKEIAEALSITAGTVKVHLMHIFEKTGVKDRFQLALHGRQWAEPDAGALRRTLET